MAGCQPPVPADSRHQALTQPPVVKPIRYIEYDREGAAAPQVPAERPSLVIVNTGANLGYAGGNNVGIRHAQRQPDVAFVWILNNDTAAYPQALDRLVARAVATPVSAITGSTLLYYDEPAVIQAAAGATYFPVFGLSRLAAHMTPFARL